MGRTMEKRRRSSVMILVIPSRSAAVKTDTSTLISN